MVLGLDLSAAAAAAAAELLEGAEEFAAAEDDPPITDNAGRDPDEGAFGAAPAKKKYLYPINEQKKS